MKLTEQFGKIIGEALSDKENAEPEIWGQALIDLIQAVREYNKEVVGEDEVPTRYEKTHLSDESKATLEKLLRTRNERVMQIRQKQEDLI